MTTVELIETTAPIGDITLAVRGARLCALNFTDRWARRRAQLENRFRGAEFRHAREAAGIVRRLRDYFDGDLGALAAIEVDPAGTAFQQRVWNELRRVGPGQTISYGELARRIGAASASRAVGAANGANPIAIIIPCHRVIGSDGSLTGYGGGMERKRWLLEHEAMHSQASVLPSRAGDKTYQRLLWHTDAVSRSGPGTPRRSAA